ncbi:MAG: DegT/DnrJ/EryC1/StrS family aminotransferase [Syntrophus sp. (in: bacteria)]
MNFIDLAAQQLKIKDIIDQNIAKVLSHGQYIMGPEIRELEEKLAAYVGVKHAVGCASGTDALLMALMVYGVGPGDAIFTTPFTFVATAEVISLLGATPVFVDIDPVTFNIDPVKLEQAILALKMGDPSRHPLPVAIDPAAAAADGAGLPVAPMSGAVGAGMVDTDGKQDTFPRSDTFALRPKGIIAVDLFGLPADYDVINAIARKHDLFVIEDAAQSFGAEYQGRKSCSLADIACTSFFPAKPLGGYGDGGMLFTDNDELVNVLRSIRVHGQGSDKYENVRIGINGRLDTLQAAILLAKFAIFPEEVELRQNVAERYRTLLTAADHDLSVDQEGRKATAALPEENSFALRTGREEGAVAVIAPTVPSGYKSVWAQYSILAKDEGARARLQEALKSAGIPTAIYYPLPLHFQGAFASLGYKSGDFPVTEEMARRIFSVPMHPYLRGGEQELICRHLKGNV